MTAKPLTPLTHHDPYIRAAIDGELRNLAQLPDENPVKPGSFMFASMIRLASVGKAAHMSPGMFVPHIATAVAHSPRPLRERDLHRQWSRAWKMAQPRAVRS